MLFVASLQTPSMVTVAPCHADRVLGTPTFAHLWKQGARKLPGETLLGSRIWNFYIRLVTFLRYNMYMFTYILTCLDFVVVVASETFSPVTQLLSNSESVTPKDNFSS